MSGEVANDASRVLLLALLDQIEGLLGDVRKAIDNTQTGKGGTERHG